MIMQFEIKDIRIYCTRDIFIIPCLRLKLKAQNNMWIIIV